MQVEELISEMETIVYSGTKLDLSYCIDDYLDEDQQDDLYDYFIESNLMILSKHLQNLMENMMNLS